MALPPDLRSYFSEFRAWGLTGSLLEGIAAALAHAR